eukprot:scaffold38918_cov176-Amphora_coffeaeformis.AAC.4
MGQNNFSIILVSFLPVKTWNNHVRISQQPRMREAPREINVWWISTGDRWLLGTKNVGKDLKVYSLKFAVSLLKDHPVAIFAIAVGGDVAPKINGRLLVVLALAPISTGAVRTRVGDIVRNEGRE